MRLTFTILSVFMIGLLGSCSKSGSGTTEPALGLEYPDSILYLGPGNNLVMPVKGGPGSYWAYPEGIELNATNGEIDIAKSETGLRYRIYFKPANRDTTLLTTVVLSGINYFDHIYNLSLNDTICSPVYNASVSRTIPVSAGNTVFDENDGCRTEGVQIDKNNAMINLAKSIREGLFGDNPSNSAQKEVELLYRINDKSNKSQNKLRIKLYYFNTAEDISEDLKQLLKDREGMVFGMKLQEQHTGMMSATGTAGTQGAAGVAKPRPPCIFIVKS